MYQLGKIRSVLMFFLAASCTEDVVGQIAINKAPLNVAVEQGSPVKLECSVEQSELLPDHIAWEECITDGVDCVRISNDLDIVYESSGGDVTRQERYGVTNVTSDQFNLAISNVMMAEDAGKYRCRSRNNPATFADAQVIILESPTSCTSNASSNLTTDDGTRLPILISCELNYNGSIEPVIEFTKQVGNTNSTLPSTEEPSTAQWNVHYTLLYEVQQGDNEARFHARTFFRSPTVSENEATNAPSYEHVLTYGPIMVVDSAFPLHANYVSIFILITVAIFL